jgi:hypothetical protein
MTRVKAELAKVMDAWSKCYSSRSVSLSQVKEDFEKAKGNGFRNGDSAILELGY